MKRFCVGLIATFTVVAVASGVTDVAKNEAEFAPPPMSGLKVAELAPPLMSGLKVAEYAPPLHANWKA